MHKNLILLSVLFIQYTLNAQSIITVYPDSLQQALGSRYEYGAFYVPKTVEAQTDFLTNGDHLNTIRLHIIESALNNSVDLNGTLAYLDNVSAILQDISTKTDRVIFILEKMPAWLSSSSDGSAAQTPGWFVLNTKPPANYTDWNNMVSAVTDRIVNTFGISNAYFEVWNEPDLGSWTGSQSEYFELFQHSYDAIKSINATIPVGGPATNHWANNISYTAPFGFVGQSDGNLSLIAQLIDSTEAWSKPLDFVSWHNFNLTVETHQNAIDFISEKYTTLGSTIPDLFVSEWNAPSAVRDTDLHYAFAAKNSIAMKNTIVASDVIAAWQDFESSSIEFHNDYGLLTYGSIRKPFYNVVSLASEIKGVQVKNEHVIPISVESSIQDDTLTILVTNYTPPPLVEALNHTLFHGQFTAVDLDNAGYIDLANNDLTILEAIYSGQTTIPNSNLLNQAINSSIAIYDYFDSVETINHSLQIDIHGFTNNYSAIAFHVNNTTNNDQFTYDSLIANGFTQTTAIAAIQGNQSIQSNAIQFTAGSYTVDLKPNGVVLFKVHIPELLALKTLNPSSLRVYPNPAEGEVTIENTSGSTIDLKVFDGFGKELESLVLAGYSKYVHFSNYPPGIYRLQTQNGQSFRIIIL